MAVTDTTPATVGEALARTSRFERIRPRPWGDMMTGMWDNMLGQTSDFTQIKLGVAYEKADTLFLTFLCMHNAETTMEAPNVMHPEMAMAVRLVRAALRDTDKDANVTLSRLAHRLPATTLCTLRNAVVAAKIEIEDDI